MIEDPKKNLFSIGVDFGGPYGIYWAWSWTNQTTSPNQAPYFNQFPFTVFYALPAFGSETY